MRIENKKLTCDYKSQIAENKNQDLSTCEAFCDQAESCNFFFYNEDGYCSLHASCVEKRVPITKGSTFETKTGNNAIFIYHSNHLHTLIITFTCHNRFTNVTFIFQNIFAISACFINLVI